MMDEPLILPAGDAAFTVDVGDRIDPAVNARVRSMAAYVASALSAHPRAEVIPAYATFLVSFDPTVLDAGAVEAVIRQAGDREPEDPAGRRRFVLPVCYGNEHGPDLEDVARHHGISPETVIERHAGRDYPIYCLGFSPGFPFLGNLDPSLTTPRLDTPRPRVPAGSVGIAGSQTGVYPTATPGGWRLIGRTPLVLFDITRSPPVPYGPGDVIRFAPITAEQYDRIKDARTMPEGAPIEA